MKIMEVTEKKVGKMSDMLEEMLTIGGKLMSCIKDIEEGGHDEDYGERRNMRHEDSDYDYRRRYSKY